MPSDVPLLQAFAITILSLPLALLLLGVMGAACEAWEKSSFPRHAPYSVKKEWVRDQDIRHAFN